MKDRDIINIYEIDNEEKNKIKLQALNIIKRSKHFDFFKVNLHDYSAINKYKGFTFLDKHHDVKNYDNHNKLSYQITYICLYITTCLLEDYADYSCELENDLEGLIYNINYIKQYGLSEVFCEIKYFLLAYKVLCQVDKKINAHIDIEYWMCDLDTQKPKKEWYSYYLPVNIDDESCGIVLNKDIQKARKMIR